MKVELAGGRPVRLAEVGMGTREASWGPDDSIIVALRSEGLARVPGTGGEPVSIITPEGDNQYWYPQVPRQWWRGIVYRLVRCSS